MNSIMLAIITGCVVAMAWNHKLEVELAALSLQTQAINGMTLMNIEEILEKGLDIHIELGPIDEEEVLPSEEEENSIEL